MATTTPINILWAEGDRSFADGNIIYFKHGFGGMDIWGTMQQGKNVWGEAHNLGPKVNTAGADMCPALPPNSDSITWISTRSDNSLGNIDIFWTNKANIRP